VYVYGDAERHTLYTRRETATIVCGRLVTLCSLSISLSLFSPFFTPVFFFGTIHTAGRPLLYMCILYNIIRAAISAITYT